MQVSTLTVYVLRPVIIMQHCLSCVDASQSIDKAVLGALLCPILGGRFRLSIFKCLGLYVHVLMVVRFKLYILACCSSAQDFFFKLMDISKDAFLAYPLSIFLFILDILRISFTDKAALVANLLKNIKTI